MKNAIIRNPATAALLLLAAGCTATAPTPPPRVGAAPAPVAAQPRAAGLVVGKTTRELEAAFGTPRATLTEGDARRLQFASETCVLDAYLYPRGGGEHAVTHIDARRPTGEDIDRASCVAALRQTRSPS
ncbi:MAG TPA: hypothetical protein VEZ48_05245 [Sphingomonadaceae bacterium]|nr:hypothetical protein [Sphingomonadaceae bacterium]